MRYLKTFKPREIPAAMNLGPPSSEVNHLVSTFFPQPYLNKKEISLSMCSFQTRKVLKRKISKFPNYEVQIKNEWQIPKLFNHKMKFLFVPSWLHWKYKKPKQRLTDFENCWLLKFFLASSPTRSRKFSGDCTHIESQGGVKWNDHWFRFS